MSRAFFAFFALTLVLTSAAQAGQVIMSCDFDGFQGINDVQVKRGSAGLSVDLFVVGEQFNYYSLPFIGSEIGAEIDLSGLTISMTWVGPESPGRWRVGPSPLTAVVQSGSTALNSDSGP